MQLHKKHGLLIFIIFNKTLFSLNSTGHCSAPLSLWRSHEQDFTDHCPLKQEMVKSLAAELFLWGHVYVRWVWYHTRALSSQLTESLGQSSIDCVCWLQLHNCTVSQEVTAVAYDICPFIQSRVMGVGPGGQQSPKRPLDFTGPSHFIVLLQWDHKVFRGEPRDLGPPGCPWFFSESPSGGAWWKITPGRTSSF